jgi:UDP-glucuronate 4-epimerase
MSTGLRFFTFSSPWGRPDMAMFPFVNAATADRPIRLLNHGGMRRDFTCIDDVTSVVSKLIDPVPADDPAAANAPSRVSNVGKHHLEELTHVGCRGPDARHRLCAVNADRARGS